jgi:hypothetical protein
MKWIILTVGIVAGFVLRIAPASSCVTRYAFHITISAFTLFTV